MGKGSLEVVWHTSIPSYEPSERPTPDLHTVSRMEGLPAVGGLVPACPGVLACHLSSGGFRAQKLVFYIARRMAVRCVPVRVRVLHRNPAGS